MTDIHSNYLLDVATRIGNHASAVIREPYTWRAPVRRVYVCTWPVSLVVRAVYIAALIVATVVCGAIGHTAQTLAYTWRGERSPWD